MASAALESSSSHVLRVVWRRGAPTAHPPMLAARREATRFAGDRRATPRRTTAIGQPGAQALRGLQAGAAS
jgi:hypothetical protein